MLDEVLANAVPDALEVLGLESIEEYRAKKQNEKRRRIAGVYFIRQGDDGYIKIGYSEHIKKRLRGLQGASPVKLQLLATMNGTTKDEQDLHKRFKSYRKMGEWFEPVPELLDFINRL